VDFFNVLTGPDLLDRTDAYLPAHRERLYPPTVTLSMFMKQALSADRSCQRAVNAWAAQRTAEGLTVQSIRTGAYCRARQRLPVQMVTALARESGRLLSKQARRGWRWRGRVVKLADGTFIAGSFTQSNDGEYIQTEVAFANQRWYKLDPEKVVTTVEVKNPDLSKVDEVGLADLMPSGGHGNAGWVNLSTIELYAKPVPR